MCTERPPLHAPTRQAGLSLIELIAFIVIVGVGLAGILSVMNITLRTSADPLVGKQQLAIAESLLEEIQSKPFTWCDPDDPNAETATSAASCSPGMAQGLGPVPASETRYNASNRFDNVGDYHGFSMPAGIYNPDDGATLIPGLSGYSASVSIVYAGTTDFSLADNTAALKIRVTVQAPASGLPPLTLTGYRFRYAPQ